MAHGALSPSPLWGGSTREAERGGGLTIESIAAGTRFSPLTPTPDLRSDPPHKGEGECPRLRRPQ